jgi:hypothetical protein
MYHIIFSENCAAYEIKSEKFGTAGQATYDDTIQRMGIASWINKSVDIFKICNNYCSFTVPIVTRMRFKITLLRMLLILFSLVQTLCNLG